MLFAFSDSPVHRLGNSAAVNPPSAPARSNKTTPVGRSTRDDSINRFPGLGGGLTSSSRP
jgi:hypothetical protein